ncbi:flavin reductase family protein [Desulfosarcina sp.]|uniref:flavin reductase family protein n=1 Tax=Desulfosarcina sp. TaxID=2027861 RepID=UPI0039706B05
MNEDLQKNMAHMTYGIYLLTTRHEGIVNGMIASWVSQISYEPPLIMVAVHPNRYTHVLLAQSGCFALHILADGQTHLVARFKGPDPAVKFESLSWSDGVTGCPILADCIGCMECRIMQTLEPGNHTLFVGEVVRSVFNAQNRPLCTLDYHGCYLGKS